MGWIRVLVDYGAGLAKIFSPSRKDQQQAAAALAVPTAPDAEPPSLIVVDADRPVPLQGTPLEQLDRVDRERWSRACAYTFKVFPAEVIHAIAAGGKARFISIARPVYAAHGFQYDDYERMYDLIVARSNRLKAKGILTGGGGLFT